MSSSWKRRKNLVFFIIAPAIIIIDQLTKLIVIDKFYLSESLSVINGFFNLTYIRNTGAAFGFLADVDPSLRVPLFLVIPAIALVVIWVIFKKIPENNHMVTAALSLVVGGAVGNLIDRIRLGYVVDFLDFHWNHKYHFAAFNAADSAICIGVGLLMLDIFNNRSQENVSASNLI